MNTASPSPEYLAAIRAEGFGSAWLAANDDLAAFTHAFLTMSKAVYSEAAPKKRRNHVGQNFGFEFCYLDSVDFPNAYAFTDEAGNLFVGITTSLYGLVTRVCEQMFKDEAILDILEEDMAMTRDRRLRLTAEMLDLPSKDSAIVANFLSEEVEIPDYAPPDWRGQYKSAGDFLLPASAKYRVRDAILAFIFHHEMGHLIEGHVGFLSYRQGVCAVRESDCAVDKTAQRLAMEFQADMSAARALVLLAGARHAIAPHVGIENDWNRIVTLDLLAIYVTHTILTFSQVATEFVLNGGSLGEAEMKAIFHRSATYPSAGVRTVSSLNTYIRAVEATEKNIDADIIKDETRFLKTLQIMQRLANTYAEFAMMLGIMNIHEDGFHEERQSILHGAAVEQLVAACAPYSFGAFGD